MRPACASALAALSAMAIAASSVGVDGHTFGPAVTWNREISRLVYDRCASCHRPGGSAFSLMTYAEAQPHANDIKDAVLTRRMPPWGAVKGFGNFRNDQGLSQEQVELVTRWVDGGIRRGSNPRQLPKPPTFTEPPLYVAPPEATRITGELKIATARVLDGLLPEHVPAGRSIRIVARLPNGAVQPLVWLYGYDNRYRHPFLFRSPIALPAGTTIEGVPADAVIALLSAEKRP